ncbi:unnamed protein product [Cuscuta epithymum]|uniref:Uncharacterized protein n=1 Tax=Cuscuta epithymum TaxID=186058 RepID=A0AAV0FHN7_9ASTE|nr:unnamed protein product [Cuscuta epithymum]
MLGRVRRPSISSLEQLELERQPPRLTKTDSLSIYETTLLKLREGSRRCEISSCLEDLGSGSMSLSSTENSFREEASALDSNSSSGGSAEDSPRPQLATRHFSLPYLFLRYRILHGTVRSPDRDDGMHSDHCYSTENALIPPVCPGNLQNSS